MTAPTADEKNGARGVEKTIHKGLSGFAIDFRLNADGRIVGYDFPLGINKDYRAEGTAAAEGYRQGWNEAIAARRSEDENAPGH